MDDPHVGGEQPLGEHAGGLTADVGRSEKTSAGRVHDLVVAVRWGTSGDAVGRQDVADQAGLSAGAGWAPTAVVVVVPGASGRPLAGAAVVVVPTGASGRPLAGAAVVVVPTGASRRPLAGAAVVVVPTGASGRASMVGVVLALAEAA